jgi:hypothetical protein
MMLVDSFHVLARYDRDETVARNGWTQEAEGAQRGHLGLMLRMAATR